MVHFPFSPSKERLKLESDLDFIQNHITNARQFALLNKRALKLFNNRWVRRGGPRVEDIIAVIREVRTKISEIPLDSSSDPSVNDHQKYCEILGEGIANLNSLTNRSHRRIETDELREREAIERDQAKIDQAIRIQASLPPPTTTEIQIYSMDNPTDSPIITISEDFSRYNEIAWYLYSFHAGFVLPELWVRLRAQHGMGKHGYKWKFAEGPNTIESRELDVINMKDRPSSNYIVALAHDKITGQEIPLPMDVTNWYDFNNEAKRCCNPFCGNLRTHLQRHFPDRFVVDAKSLQDPSKCVIDLAFDTNQFPARTNNLYLQWRPLARPV